VQMLDFSFGPQVVSVQIGDTVRWSHAGDFPHTVMADSQAWGSPELNSGEIYERAFTAPGTYAYYCTLHGSAGGVGMAGVIQVQDPSGAPLPTLPPAPTAPPAPTLPPAPPAPAGTTDVATIDFSFAPRTVTISLGSTIRWVNTGRSAHTVTSSNQPWDSGRMNSGAVFQRTFTTPGTYAYYCTYHGSSGGSGMAGTIIVQDAGAPGATPAPTQPPLPPASAPYLTTALAGGSAFPAATGTATYDNRSGQPQFRLELRAGQSYQSAGVDIFIDGVKVAEAEVNDKGECRLELRSTNGDSVPNIYPGAQLVMRLSNGTLLATGTF
jgi:plastocyanin